VHAPMPRARGPTVFPTRSSERARANVHGHSAGHTLGGVEDEALGVTLGASEAQRGSPRAGGKAEATRSQREWGGARQGNLAVQRLLMSGWEDPSRTAHFDRALNQVFTSRQATPQYDRKLIQVLEKVQQLVRHPSRPCPCPELSSSFTHPSSRWIGSVHAACTRRRPYDVRQGPGEGPLCALAGS
jgi:hypothetical protein